MKITLQVWRQEGPGKKGRFEKHEVDGVSGDMSFLEMLDILNERLEVQGKPSIAFESDCREGICGTCGIVINGHAHGPERAITTCQLHMRSFNDGDTLYLEPWRASGFPVLRDLVVDRAALDRIMEAGGYISVDAGSPPDGNAIPVPKQKADRAMDAAQCIQCGACVAACPNGSASLFTAAKVAHLAQLPQGQPERYVRVQKMVQKMDEYFGSCTNIGECQEACPKEISISFISEMNRDYIRANFCELKAVQGRVEAQ